MHHHIAGITQTNVCNIKPYPKLINLKFIVKIGEI